MKSCKERNEKFTQNHGLEIKMLSRIAEAAQASTAVSRKFLCFSPLTSLLPDS